MLWVKLFFMIIAVFTAAAAPANGSHRVHGEEQRQIIEEAFANP